MSDVLPPSAALGGGVAESWGFAKIPSTTEIRHFNDIEFEFGFDSSSGLSTRINMLHASLSLHNGIGTMQASA